MLKLTNDSEINAIKSEIEQVYKTHNNTPFIIGYSGGKDSTLVLQLYIEVLLGMKYSGYELTNTVYVISADTFVENPLVIEKTRRSLNNLKKFCEENSLPIVVELVFPKFSNSFFVNLIGRGYPAPLKSFRWCTDRIKIDPVNAFITKAIDKNGEIIMVLGTREEESISRKSSMKKREMNNSTLSLHSTFDKAWTYAPLAKLSVDDLWQYLINTPCPWGDSNEELYKLYSDSSGECPLIIDTDTKEAVTCGNSRFGCWTCTVVAKDKSLTGFIESGHDYLQPLLDYRDKLIQIRDVTHKRNLFDNKGNLKLVNLVVKDDQIIIPKKNDRVKEIIPINKVRDYQEAILQIRLGQIDPLNETICVIKNGKYYRIGTSSFNIETRVELLNELLDIEIELNKALDFKLINKEEIIEIDKIWKSHGYVESAIEIYNAKYKNELLEVPNSNINYELLESLSDEFDFDFNTVVKIIEHTKSKSGLKNRSANIKYIGSKLSEYKHMLAGNYENN